MTRFWDTVAFRLALGCGLLAIGSMSVIAAAFYFGTVGVLARSTDAKLISISKRLADHNETRGGEALRQEVQQLLQDGLVQFAVQGLTMAFVNTMLFRYNAQLAALVIFIVVPLLTLLSLWFRSASDVGFNRVRDGIAFVAVDPLDRDLRLPLGGCPRGDQRGGKGQGGKLHGRHLSARRGR